MELLTYDVICIGSGVAGMMASIFASNAGAKVCLISKEPLGWGNTRISGGIIGTNGSVPKKLLSDMLESGKFLNQRDLLDVFIEKSTGIHELIESWGHIFLSEQDKKYKKKMIKPGGHSEARTLISHQRGIMLANTLRSKLLQSNICIMEEMIACKVLIREGKASGVILYDWKTGEWKTIAASTVILAAGGGGMVYSPHTDNMRSATGDGFALGLDAGAQLIDMEQIQFMPFGVAYPEGMIGLELGDTSAAGPYGVLKNQLGEIICRELPDKTREEVSKIIALEIEAGNGSPHGGIWLDPTENRNHEEGEESWGNWKTIGSLDPLKQAYGSKAFQWKEPFEVLPTQHYIMGGLLINNNGQTTVPGLFAAGENSGGLHGAGRMGSMSLFEGLVFGRIIGTEAVNGHGANEKLSMDEITEEIEDFKSYISRQKGEHNPIKLKQAIGNVMWKHAGILRSETGLHTGLNLVSEIEEKSHALDIEWKNGFMHQTLEAIELRSMLLTAKSILLSALARKESRGSHYRRDFPNTDDKVKNIFIQLKDGNLITSYTKEKSYGKHIVKD